ncbi:MAG: hypothetical protein [Arizlama microvirus]|nr:MAG: hypothetical protein [Arizlama microvirus]
MEDVYKTTDKHNRFDESGHEVLNPTPMQPPLGYERPVSLVDQIRQQIRNYKMLEDNEPETEEEADDFEIEEDPIMQSRWENDMVPSIKEARQRLRRLEEAEKLFAKPETPAVNPGAGPPEKGPAQGVNPGEAPSSSK